MNPKVITDLNSHEHGLRIVERRAQNFLPAPDGSFLLTGEGRTQASIANFSEADAAAYDAFAGELEAIADVLRKLVLRAPPNIVEGFGISAITEGLNALGTANVLRGLSLDDKRMLLDLMTRSAGEMLDELVRERPGQGAVRLRRDRRQLREPLHAGLGLRDAAPRLRRGERQEGRLGPRHRRHGRDHVRPWRSAARAHGAEIETEAAVREVIIEGGRAVGVVLDDGRTVRARAVVSNVNPKLLYTRLVPADALPAKFLARMQNWRNGSGTLRMNVALSALPSFTALPGDGDHLPSGIIIAPSLDYMDRAYDDARDLGWSREPIVEMLIPSTLDDTLAPKGAHVASLFCQHVAPELPDGASWDDHRDEVADLMIATVDRYAPGFKQSVVGRQVLTPLDLERDFGLLGGDIFHGALTLNQLFSARPMLGHADYRGPIKGLYHCGSGAHPGGGVTGAPGHNAAKVILSDLRGIIG